MDTNFLDADSTFAKATADEYADYAENFAVVNERSLGRIIGQSKSRKVQKFADSVAYLRIGKRQVKL